MPVKTVPRIVVIKISQTKSVQMQLELQNVDKICLYCVFFISLINLHLRPTPQGKNENLFKCVHLNVNFVKSFNMNIGHIGQISQDSFARESKCDFSSRFTY